MQDDGLDIDIQYIKGIGPYNKKLLNKKGIHTAVDLLENFPRDYEDRRRILKISQVNLGTCTVAGRVFDINEFRHQRPTRVEVILEDDSGRIPLVFFNQNYIAKVISKGDPIVATGNAEFNYGRLFFNNPDWEKLDDAGKVNLNHGRIVPVYGLTEGLSQSKMRTFIYNALTHFKDKIEDPIPKEALEPFDLPEREIALIRTHFPKPEEDLRAVREYATQYQKRMVFEEIFYLQYFWKRRKQEIKSQHGISFALKSEGIESFLAALPFELTASQKRVLEEIFADMKSDMPMNRLLQGDVGSGKTVVAFTAAVNAVLNGYQAAVMAPTEVLAHQHYVKACSMLQHLDFRVEYLFGKQKKSDKERITEKLGNGEINVIVGTHALFQENVNFRRLGLVVIDEQHRFGVEQRMELMGKGNRPDTLVMSATPIPRSVAMTIYGDMDYSVIDEMPKGRKEIFTEIASGDEEYLYSKIKETLERGESAYVVYPLIEETEKSDLKAAESGYEHLRKRFGDSTGLLHGRMKSAEKIEAMKKFFDKRTRILVSTTVIEVGIDSPDATLMIIVNAERFGLSQLHQLRGRIGRGDKLSHCILYTDNPKNERLHVIKRHTDGFKISIEDFRIRGPGEIMGTAQSGLPPFKLFDMFRDREMPELSEKVMGVIAKLEDRSTVDKLDSTVEERYGKKFRFKEVL